MELTWGLWNRRWLGWPDLVNFRDIYTWYVTWVLGSCDWLEWEYLMILIELECGDLMRCIRTCSYFSYWDSDLLVTLRMDMSMTLRIWFDYILCSDYSFHASMWLLILNIMIYLKTWLIILDIYLITIMSILLNYQKNIIYGNNTLMLYLLHVLLYQYPVHWYYISCYISILITHVDSFTMTITELSQWSK